MNPNIAAVVQMNTLAGVQCEYDDSFTFQIALLYFVQQFEYTKSQAYKFSCLYIKTMDINIGGKKSIIYTELIYYW